MEKPDPFEQPLKYFCATLDAMGQVITSEAIKRIGYESFESQSEALNKGIDWVVHSLQPNQLVFAANITATLLSMLKLWDEKFEKANKPLTERIQ